MCSGKYHVSAFLADNERKELFEGLGSLMGSNYVFFIPSVLLM